MTSADLIETIYIVCDGCKEGKCTENSPQDALQDFRAHHSGHGIIDSCIGRVFLSEKMRLGYIDVDRPDLEPLPLPVVTVERQTGDTPPFGLPGGPEAARALQRELRGSAVELGLRSPDAPVRRAPPERDPSLRELQLTLPWTVKYSRDFRANPQAHKDFAHALIHAGKALGKLFSIVDDYDHRRESDQTERVRDYLADLIICAMRAANTMPGGTIDLLPAVRDRVIAKNPPIQGDAGGEP